MRRNVSVPPSSNGWSPLAARSAGALDTLALRQVFWRYFPAFARDRELWALTRTKVGWDNLLRDASAPALRATETLESIANEALSVPANGDAQAEGIPVSDDVCFPMVVGDASLGVVGVRNAPPMSIADRRALGAAVSLLAIAIRNVQLLTQTRESSVRDQLTGCFNRAYAIESLGSELQRSRRSGRPLSVMMFDVDKLKRINDDHGHLAGDALLAVGRRSGDGDASCQRHQVPLGWRRVSGHSSRHALALAPSTPAALSRARSAPSSSRRRQGRCRRRSALALRSLRTVSADPLAIVARADAALYKAKHAGRNRFVIAQSDIRAAG